jgi:hypothetical protein
MLQHLAGIDPSDRASLRDALTAHLREITTSAARGDRTLVARAETDVRGSPEACFRFDATGRATLHAAGRTFQAGTFETPRLGDLRRRAEDARRRAGDPATRLRFHVLDGASPATDIGALQATAPPGSLFQVASQFNCLESPSARLVPVSEYFRDPTQGPRASISAFPGTLLRHYAAPAGDGSRFVQGAGGRQLDLLEAVCAPDVATVTSGYLMAHAIAAPDRFARALEERFDDVRVGVHDAIEVVFGHAWDGPVRGAPQHTIAQVLTSTLAAGGYGRFDPSSTAMGTVVRQLQRAAYAGTLLAAANLGQSHVGLTLIGGGVFGNPIPTIWESILWAVDCVKPMLHRDLCVVLNGYALGRHLPAPVLLEAATARGGTLVVFDATSVSVGEVAPSPLA